MAGVLVGGAFLSGFINVVLDRLISADAVNLVVGKKLSSDLVERLRNALTDAGALVDDAELKQLDNHDVKDWLNSLRDALYTADDLLDRICTKAATQKVTLLGRIFNSEDRQMVNEIERVVRRIEDLEKRKGKLGLEKISTASFSWKTPSTSLVKGNVYGREDDQKALIKMLNDNNEHHLSVISIVGMGGVGKTTLAQWMYNNAELMVGFDRKAWVCVSENFNIVETTKNIVKEISTNTQDLDSLNSIQDALKKELSEKKFFVVLDDVWSNDHLQWKDFLAPFQYGVKGSTILLTTRKEDVGSVVQTNYHPHYLNPLSEDYCWSVFAANASFPESNGSPTLEGIGKRIARKCDGLPLAAETLGCLCRRHDAEEWEKILRSDIWRFSTNENYLLDKDELILLWMTEDLLRLPNRGESFEEVGCKYFEELASRLFFKPSKYNFKRFVMHDLLHDLAIFLAGDFYYRIQELGEQEKKKVLTRHLSHFPRGSLGPPITKVSNSIAKLESFRTSLYIDDLFSMESGESKFKYLRVLSFVKLDVLPDSIGELIHLRYLNLSWCKINRLPESLCNLYNLQTLILYGCTKLTMLPSGMHNLVNLRHLDLRATSLEEMPRGISELKHMPILDYFVVGKHKDNGIQELGGLSNLEGSFEIRKLENIVDVKEAENARMINKNLISKLYLQWSSGGDMVSNTQTEREILHSLAPHNGLKELRIRGYRGTRFADWLGHSSYSKMTHVSLVCCMNCCMLPSLGQLPSLKSLYIQDFSQLSSIGIEFYKNEDNPSLHIAPPFPLLESLKFYNMACWEEWHLPDSKAFPQLKSLEMRDCPMLKGDMLNHVLMRIVSSSMDVSKVRKLEIRQDDIGGFLEMVLSGDTLSFSGCESMVESAIKAMMSINHLSCLQEIEISECSSLISLSLDAFPNLKGLEIKGCSNLESVSMSEPPSKSLQNLRIMKCRKLEFLQQQHKYDLVGLYIFDSCDSLTSLSLDAFPSLKVLEIKGCSNLESVSMSEPPSKSLQNLRIIKCRKLEFLQQQQKYDLVSLYIFDSCDSLTSLSLDAFPNLKNLEIFWCRNLESLSMSEAPHAALQRLSIAFCNKLVSLAGEGQAAPNLTHLSLIECSKLEALPRDMNSLFPSLHSLHIYCPNICRLAEGDLPPNLKVLEVGICEEQMRDLSWMANLHALTRLIINGSWCKSIKSYPEVGSLPHLPSLTTLVIWRFHNLETLECNKLLRLTSLRQLHISYCWKLENMEGEKLPPSLLLLKVYHCHLLGEHCRNKHQQIWPKISHIPTIKVNGEQMF
ncbi:putative disease resistance RPP13-like protein 1 isoform X2 [Arachis stenosperma]|uniref:putative disease resistance RPP13-like protein 1 isoform X2 n=1 Tax=Arachis stenosperma TaxID=217475 RepID=UPI0025AD97DB|nr:putative disease resistance RPP13-like protein 1 isoform X2 [Arachis stenosperma]